MLQVLLSISSLILGTADPIGNEPGYEKHVGTQTSKAYNYNLRRMTTKVAILQALKDPEHPCTWQKTVLYRLILTLRYLFVVKEIIQTHFRLKAREILKQLDM